MLLAVASAVVAAVVVVVAPVDGADLPALAATRAPTGLVTRAAPSSLTLQCLQEAACRAAAVGDADGVLRADWLEPATLRLTLHRKDGVVVGEERVTSAKRELLGAALDPVVTHLLATASTLTPAPSSASSSAAADDAGDVAADAGGPSWPWIVGGVCVGGCALCGLGSLGLVVLAAASDSGGGSSSGSSADCGDGCDLDLGLGDACSESIGDVGSACDGIGDIGDACAGVGDIGGSCAAPAVRGPLAPGATPTSPTFLVPPPAEDDVGADAAAARRGEMPW